MDAMARAHAFGEGYTTKPNGSGIGLFMCKSLAEARGGSVEIDTAAERGTAVRVRLPLQTQTTIAGG
jgi:signal transduction histidine kinase